AVSNVRFTLVASGASAVAVAGSFNGWSTAATPLRRIDKNTWTADIPLGAGRYVYQFVIDGHRWVPDPKAPRDAGDDFGATNSVVTVAGSGSA
ncbi:MAG TPA: isoamylase early set domain-containing protein, partial [Gemmatimonadaceae bacterium]|nr:isoamylase early set domain-containing protein [Gemmatimonadaceae bacterium]